MKKPLAVFAGALITLATAGVAFSQTGAPASGQPSKPGSTSEAKPASDKASDKKKVEIRHVTGEVVSTDQKAKTLTVKWGPKGKSLVFETDQGAVGALADLKAGDKVKVGYVREHDQLMAREITKTGD